MNKLFSTKTVDLNLNNSTASFSAQIKQTLIFFIIHLNNNELQELVKQETYIFKLSLVEIPELTGSETHGNY